MFLNSFLAPSCDENSSHVHPTVVQRHLAEECDTKMVQSFLGTWPGNTLLTVRNSSSIPFKVPKRSVVVAFNHNYRQDRQCVGNYFQVLIWLFSFFFFTSTTWELSHLHLGLSLHEVADYFLNWWLLFLISQISTDDRISSAAISGQEFPRRVVLGRWIVHSPGMRQVGWFDNYIYVDVANRVL